MNCIKRDGTSVPIDLKQLEKQISPACKGLDNVSSKELLEDAKVLIRDNVPTTEIQTGLVKLAVDKIDVHCSDWSYVAGRLFLYNIYHTVKRYFGVTGSGDVYKMVTLQMTIDHSKMGNFKDKYTKEEVNELNNYIVGERDLLMPYSSVSTGSKMYFKKDNDDSLFELPQYMHMGVAMVIAQNDDDKMNLCKELYDAYSLLEFINSTPTNSNSRNIKPSTISCLITGIPDAIAGIFDKAKEVALGSQQGSGWGLDWSLLRSKGSVIDGVKGIAGGKISFLKIFNDISVAVDQLGKRPGVFAVYIETWDIDILDFLDLKKKNGDERARARDLFTAVNMYNLLIERDSVDGEWTLFDPYDVPKLLREDSFGPQFEKYYAEYVEDFKRNPDNFNPNTVTMSATDLFRKICLNYYLEGMPFMHFVDNTNKRHQYPELGKIRALNLCTEILQGLRPRDTIVCNLGSINLARVNSESELRRVVRLACITLDNTIDITMYPSESARRTQMERRSIGIGLLGEAEMIANMKIIYGSDAHIEIIDKVYGIVRNEIDIMSKKLAIEKGSCIIKGERFAYKMATAPNSTSAIFAGTTNSIEAVFDKKWVEDSNGQVITMTAPNINPSNYDYYTPVYDVDQTRAMTLTVIRNKHVDQGISHNIHVKPAETKLSTIRLLVRHASRIGLGSTYYLRSKAPVNDKTIMPPKITCFGCDN